MPGSLATSAAGSPQTPAGLGSSAPPNVAAPWRGPTRYALRSSARLMARRTRTSVNGARLKLTSTLSLTLVSASSITSLAAPLLAFSALVLFQPLPATSSWPDCSAAICVERSRMITNLMPSRYGRPLMK